MIKKIKKKLNEVKDKIKLHFHNILTLKTTPHEIALGFAIGTFIEILPTFLGLDYVIALLVILIYPKVSKVSLFAALVLLNFIILTPIHTLNYFIGDLIFAGKSTLYFNIEFWDNLFNVSRRFLVGSLITAPIFSYISYVVIKKLVINYRKKHKDKLKNNKKHK